MRLNNVDFPTLGRPTIDTTGNAVLAVITPLQVIRLFVDPLAQVASQRR